MAPIEFSRPNKSGKAATHTIIAAEMTPFTSFSI